MSLLRLGYNAEAKLNPVTILISVDSEMEESQWMDAQRQIEDATIAYRSEVVVRFDTRCFLQTEDMYKFGKKREGAPGYAY